MYDEGDALFPLPSESEAAPPSAFALLLLLLLLLFFSLLEDDSFGFDDDIGSSANEPTIGSACIKWERLSDVAIFWREGENP